MAKDYGTFECAYCGKVNKCKHPSISRNKYCSNRCQGEHRTKEKVDLWLESGNAFYKNKMTPPFVKSYIKDRDGNKCVMCGISHWQDKPLVLEVDHIDGDYRNNNEANLRTLCPNCHSQTDTYKNNNTGKGRSSR